MPTQGPRQGLPSGPGHVSTGIPLVGLHDGLEALFVPDQHLPCACFMPLRNLPSRQVLQWRGDEVECDKPIIHNQFV